MRAQNRIYDGQALFLLFFSGLRITNMLYFTLQDIENIFYNSDKVTTRVKVIKNKRNEFHVFTVSENIKNLFFNKYELKKDLEIIFKYTTDYCEKIKIKISFNEIFFYNTLSNPLKQGCVTNVKNRINTILKKAQNEISPFKHLSSHSFRINFITHVIKQHGYEMARLYAHHTDINTTKIYDRSPFNNDDLNNLSETIINQNLTDKDKNLLREANKLGSN